MLRINPKGYTITWLMFRQFAVTNTCEPWLWVLSISRVFTTKNLIDFTIWTLPKRRFCHPHQVKFLHICLALNLGAGLWMLAQRLT